MNKSAFSFGWAWPYLVLVAAVCAVYGNVYHNAFLFDDNGLIIHNRLLQSWQHVTDIFASTTTAGAGGASNFYRPLQIFLYFLTNTFFGFSEPAFHALNIVLHAANAGLVLYLAQNRLKFKTGPAIIAALLWAVHPLHTEAVTYMSATADPLHVLFILCGLLAWDGGNRRRQWLALVCFGFALLSKESAVVFPGLLAVMLYFTTPEIERIAALRRTWPCWLLAAAYLAFHFFGIGTANVAGASPVGDIGVRFLTFLSTLPEYMRLLVQPSGLHMERHWPVAESLADGRAIKGLLIFGVSLALIAGACIARAPYLSCVLGFTCAWFLAAYLPCSGVLVPVNALFLEHWMYLPSIGLFLGAGELIGAVVEKRHYLKWPLAGAGAVMCVAFAFSTLQQNKIWADPFTFFSHIIKYEAGFAPRAYLGLGTAYETIGHDAEALENYQRAATIDPQGLPQAYMLIGGAQSRLGHFDESRQAYEKALALKPGDYLSLVGLARLYRNKGDAEKAAHYQALADEQRRLNPYLAP